MRDDWVTVIPERGAIADTARALIALARSPYDVRTARGGREFRVPPYLADAYNKPAPAPKAPAPAEAPKPPRRRTRKDGDE